MNYNTITTPTPLRKGDKIAIVSPASVVKEEYVRGTADFIRRRGYEPVIFPHALGPHDGSFAASRQQRTEDLQQAVADPQIKAIFCSRGGYGCTQLLTDLSPEQVADNPKWIVGFSDVSALLALWYRSGVASIHGPMAKHLATHPDDDFCSEALFNILESGGNFDYSVPSHIYNVPGECEGTIVGGNFAVLNDLIGSMYDVLIPRHTEKDIILFLEDINEPIYKVNRMLWHLYNSEVFLKIKGIIFGQFTDYHPDANFESMDDMIKEFLDNPFIKAMPVVFDFPVGHTDINFPIVEGARVKLSVTPTQTRLTS